MALSPRPIRAQRFRLLKHRLRRFLLFIRRITVRPQNPLHRSTNLGPHHFALSKERAPPLATDCKTFPEGLSVGYPKSFALLPLFRALGSLGSLAL
jgi:hypothetical protein